MSGVIALLPEPAAGYVRLLWQQMERDFRVPQGYPGSIPHISFHLRNDDIEAGAIPVVARVARETAPFVVFSAGLGVFGRPLPLLHVMVARSPAAASLAETLERELAAAGLPSTDLYFTPEKWIPHITIANRNLEGVDLGRLLRWLIRQDLSWEIPIRSISIARETERGAEVLGTFALGGAGGG